MKLNKKYLTDLKIGEVGKIKKIYAKGAEKIRLLDIGFTEKSEVECVLKAPGGDPIAYKVRGCVIALRNEDSDKILINP